MSMPQIPEESFRPTKEEVVIDLLKSIAMEENAIAHLLHAEAEKIQAFVGHHHRISVEPSHADLIKLSGQVTQLLDVIVMKEWLLLRKLENVMELNDPGHGWDDCNDGE
ncbi:hypothetical protein AK95_30385 [Paenibacillus sp. LC231]|uniref:hypothetical protein n=1 Tax=unclassified Paenibacillus TaxID=185978 RepID=UPI0008DCED2B|nr:MULTISPECIES: hypothetical protein [unclassified Paenibacillus]MCT1399281.1 hypothetical protein [Paenibacillus sp. p3-SID867]OIB02480.1 hypothetical protein AK95_30385 [Paenibacillus sp. LC231]